MLPKVITSLDDFNYDELNKVYQQIHSTEKQLFALSIKDIFDKDSDVNTIDIIVIAEPFHDEKEFEVRVYDINNDEMDDLSEDLSDMYGNSIPDYFMGLNSRENTTSISRKTLMHHFAKLFGEENYALYQKKLIEDDIKKPMKPQKTPKI